MSAPSNISTPHAHPYSDQQEQHSFAGCSIYHFVHALSGIVGELKNPKDDVDQEDYPSPGVLGLTAERYLRAHGYRASAVWAILYAFNESYDPQEFVSHLSAKGMPILEAEYMFELISGHDIWLTKPVGMMLNLLVLANTCIITTAIFSCFLQPWVCLSMPTNTTSRGPRQVCAHHGGIVRNMWPSSGPLQRRLLLKQKTMSARWYMQMHSVMHRILLCKRQSSFKNSLVHTPLNITLRLFCKHPI